MLPLEFVALEQGNYKSFPRNEINFLSRLSDHHRTPANKRKRRSHMSDELVCKYCDREFSSLQALGGHQNAHKREKVSLERTMKSSSGRAYRKFDGRDHPDQDLGQSGLGFYRNWMMARPETVHGYGGAWPVVLQPTWSREIIGPLVAQPRVCVTRTTMGCVSEPSVDSEPKEQIASLSSSIGLDLSLKL